VPEPILETRGLEKRFGGVRAVAGVDFRLEPGELRCLIGPNGAGKSTFFRMLTGQHRPSAGRVLFEGRDITGAEPHAIGRLGIGIKNQVPDVLNGLPVRDNLRLAATFAHRGASARRLADAVMERLDLAGIADRRAGELAHGQRQWVEIGMVVAREPRLILLDEPSAGMGPEETRRTAALVRELNRDATIVVVEHDMQFIREIARRVTVFHQGRVLREDTFERVVADPVVRDVYLGRHAAA
jgi:branched-chain amino acid transport system ATP-binding protein